MNEHEHRCVKHLRPPPRGDVQDIRTVAMEGAPEAFTQSVKQLEQGIEQWAEIQHGMWRSWCEILRASAPAPHTPGETMFEGWEDMVKRTLAMQDEWLSRGVGLTTGSGKNKSTGSS